MSGRRQKDVRWCRYGVRNVSDDVMKVLDLAIMDVCLILIRNKIKSPQNKLLRIMARDT